MFNWNTILSTHITQFINETNSLTVTWYKSRYKIFLSQLNLSNKSFLANTYLLKGMLLQFLLLAHTSQVNIAHFCCPPPPPPPPYKHMYHPLQIFGTITNVESWSLLYKFISNFCQQEIHPQAHNTRKGSMIPEIKIWIFQVQLAKRIFEEIAPRGRDDLNHTRALLASIVHCTKWILTCVALINHWRKRTIDKSVTSRQHT